MGSPDDDLEEYIEKIRSSFYEQSAGQIREGEMWTLIENLIREIGISKEHEATLEKSLKLCLEDDNANMSTKYMALKEKYDKLEREHVDLQNKMDDLRMQMAMDIEDQKTEYSSKISDLQEQNKREIASLKNQIEKDRSSHEQREQDLYNQLQMAQASTALQCDEIESNLKRQLVDTTSRLRKSQNMVRNLQIEMNNLKNQLHTQHTPPIQRAHKSDLKYQPLPLITHDASSEESEMVDFIETLPSKGVNQLVFKGIGAPRKKQAVPSLMKCTAAGSTDKPKVQKKRKLYNPNDLDYLEGLQEDQ